MSVNAQIYGGRRDGDWVQAETDYLTLVEREGETTYLVTYRADRHRWIQVNKREAPTWRRRQ